jgi:hypothetical protein
VPSPPGDDPAVVPRDDQTIRFPSETRPEIVVGAREEIRLRVPPVSTQPERLPGRRVGANWQSRPSGESLMPAAPE